MVGMMKWMWTLAGLMNGPSEKKRNPARQFEIEHKSEHGTVRACVDVPEGAVVNTNSCKFIVYDEDRELMLFGYNYVVSFKDVTTSTAKKEKEKADGC